MLWALANEGLGAAAANRLRALASAAARPESDAAEVAMLLQEARSLYQQAAVVPHATELAAAQRRLACEALSGCRLPRLREVLEFLLDLAVPEGAIVS